MIQSFQKFSQSRIAKIFLALVALSFVAFFGGGSWFGSHNPYKVVAEVGGVSISHHEFIEALQRRVQQILSEKNIPLTHEELLQTELPRLVLDQLIHERLADLEAAHLGLTVGDESLRHHIHSMKAFQNEKGVFDRAYFVQILHANGLSEDAFIAKVREELIREQLTNAIMVGAFLPPEMVERLFEAQYQHRQASLLVIKGTDMPLPSAPMEEVLETFYKQHQKQLKTPELRTFTVLLVDSAPIVQDIPITEEEIRTFYEAKKETFKGKTLAQAKPSIIADLRKEKSLEKMHERVQEWDDKIVGGSTFEELARALKGARLLKFSAIDKQGRDQMEERPPELPQDKKLAQEILKTAFELEEASDSPFVPASNGMYYAVRLDTITPAALQPLSKIKEKVLKAWRIYAQFKAAHEKAIEYVQSFNRGDRKASLMALLPNLSLAEPSPRVSSPVKQLVFSLRPGQAGMTAVPEGFAVVLLNKILPSVPKVKEKYMPSFQKALLARYKNDLVIGYLNALRIRYPVKINRVAIEKALTRKS